MEEDSEMPYLANPDADPALAPLHAAACTYRIALGPWAGQKVLTWKDPSLRLAIPEVPDWTCGAHSVIPDNQWIMSRRIISSESDFP